MKEVVIETTGYCPQNCIHCSSRKNLEGEYRLTADEMKSVLDDLFVLGVDELCFSGGEPLVYPDLDEILGYANENLDSKLTLYTCGFENYYKPIEEERLEELRDLGVDKLVFSLHGVSEKFNLEIDGENFLFDLPLSIHEFISSGGSLEPGRKDKLENLKDLIINSKKIGFETGVHFVVMKLNMYDMDNTASFLNDIAVDELSFLRYVPQGIFNEDWKKSDFAENFYGQLDTTKRDLHYIEEKLIELYREYQNKDMKIRVGDPWRSPRIKEELNLPLECKAAENVIEITYKGDVVPCPALKWIEDYNLGNIKNQSLIEIMNSKKRKTVLKNMRKENKEPCRSQTIQKSYSTGEKSPEVKRFEKMREHFIKKYQK